MGFRDVFSFVFSGIYAFWIIAVVVFSARTKKELRNFVKNWGTATWDKFGFAIIYGGTLQYWWVNCRTLPIGSVVAAFTLYYLVCTVCMVGEMLWSSNEKTKANETIRADGL